LVFLFAVPLSAVSAPEHWRLAPWGLRLELAPPAVQMNSASVARLASI
jgi:hypothetical protein